MDLDNFRRRIHSEVYTTYQNCSTLQKNPGGDYSTIILFIFMNAFTRPFIFDGYGIIFA